MEKRYYRNLIVRLAKKAVAGKATKKEEDFLDAYGKLVERDPVTIDDDDTLKEQIFADIQRRKREARVIPMYRKYMQAAAAAVLLIGISLVYFYYDGMFEATHTTIVQAQPRNLFLPDGTIVVLNTGASLEYLPDFGDGTREVYLKGEGYFDVAHDPSKPFIVHTGKMHIKVLGTAFNVRADSIGLTQVTVTRGKVQVSDDKQELAILTPNMQITYNMRTGEHTQKSLDAKTVTKWKPEYTLDNITLLEAADILEKRFGKEITFRNPEMAKCQVTAYFEEDDSFEHLLDMICAIFGATYTVDEDSGLVTIDGNCADE